MYAHNTGALEIAYDTRRGGASATLPYWLGGGGGGALSACLFGRPGRAASRARADIERACPIPASKTPA